MEAVDGRLGLPETERRALVERVIGGSGHREIAIGMGRSDAAVRQLLHRSAGLSRTERAHRPYP